MVPTWALVNSLPSAGKVPDPKGLCLRQPLQNKYKLPPIVSCRQLLLLPTFMEIFPCQSIQKMLLLSFSQPRIIKERKFFKESTYTCYHSIAHNPSWHLKFLSLPGLLAVQIKLNWKHALTSSKISGVSKVHPVLL